MIHWREQMTVDGDVIDQDHRHLIEIITISRSSPTTASTAKRGWKSCTR